MKILFNNLLLISLITFFVSCGPYQDISISKIENTRVTKMDGKVIEAEIDVKINNPNKTGFTIFKSDADVTLNGTPAGKAKLKSKVRIKAKSEETYTFGVTSSLSELTGGDGIASLIGLAFSKSIIIGVKGNIKAGKFFYKKKFPIDVKQKVPLQKS